MIIEMRIVYELETGKIMVFGPMNKKEVCYAILKKARKTIQKYQPPAVASPLLGADARPLPVHLGVA